MFFALLISTFGFAFAYRTFTHFITRELFDRAFMTKIGTVYFASVLSLIFFMPTSRFSLWCALFFPLAILCSTLSAQVSRRTRIFQTEALGVLSILILKMKSGRSFRQSLLETTSECEKSVRVKLSEIASVVAFSQQGKTAQSDPFMRELIEEFRLIDQQPHSSLRRLSVLREKIRVEDDFRRRSGQVLARLRAQSLVMCFLYLAVFIFMVMKFGWSANARALTASTMLFACGVAWIWIGGRRLKWKV
jgi:hypothetical protein